MKKITKIVATLFFIGYLPVAQGTVASAAALSVCFFLSRYPAVYIAATFVLLALGFWASSYAESEFDKKDPREIVIDEFSSLFIVYLFIPFTLKIAIIGFILFRALDIFKLPPIKRLETLPGGWGIMLDDIAAAILTNLILQVLVFCLGIY